MDKETEGETSWRWLCLEPAMCQRSLTTNSHAADSRVRVDRSVGE